MILINSETLLEQLDKRHTYEAKERNRAYGKGVRDCIKDVEYYANFESVEITLCRNCVYGQPNGKCAKQMWIDDPNGFCSKGEPNNDESGSDQSPV